MDSSKTKGSSQGKNKTKKSLANLFAPKEPIPSQSAGVKKVTPADKPSKMTEQVKESAPSSSSASSKPKKQNRKKRSAEEQVDKTPGWKRVKLSENVEFKEAGFFMLEELHYDPTQTDGSFASFIKQLPGEPAHLEEEPPVDFYDKDYIAPGTAQAEQPHSDDKMDVDSTPDPETTPESKKESKKQAKEAPSKNKPAPASPQAAQSSKPQKSTDAATSKNEQAPKSAKYAQQKGKQQQEKHAKPAPNEDVENVGGDEDLLKDYEFDDEKVEDVIDGKLNTHPRTKFVPQEELEFVDLPEWFQVYDLHKRILMALRDMGFTKPTPIQAAVLPVALGKNRKDVIGAAHTGSGKTLAFGIPIIHQILELQEKDYRMGEEPDTTLKGLILSPTRELALQIVDHLRKLAAHTNIRIFPVVGGISTAKQARFLRNKPDILVATPGRLWDLIASGTFDREGQTFAHLRFFVFDEADKMVEFGRFAELSNLMRTVYESRRRLIEQKLGISLYGEGINMPPSEEEAKKEEEEKKTKEKKEPTKSSINDEPAQAATSWKDNIKKRAKNVTLPGGLKPLHTLIFSATMAVDQEARKNMKLLKTKADTLRKLKPQNMRGKKDQEEQEGGDSGKMLELLMDQIDFQREVEWIDTTATSHQISTLEEAKIYCLNNEKDFYLYYFLKRYPGRTILFVNATSNIKRLLPLLVILRVPSFGMHANMEQQHRLLNLEKFKNSKNAVLVTTDILARGVDIPQVDHVVQYSIPNTAELFIHRSGRTARAFATGLCLHIVEPEDRRHYTSIMRTLTREEVPDFPVDMSYFAACKRRVEVATQMDKISHDIQKKTSEFAWLAQKAEDLDAEIPSDFYGDEDEGVIKQRAVDRKRLKMRYNALKDELRKLLEEPLVATGQSRKYTTRDLGAKQLFVNNSKSFQNPPELTAHEASVMAVDTDKDQLDGNWAASSSAFKDVVRAKKSKNAFKSTESIEKEKEKNKARIDYKKGRILGPLAKR